MSKLNDTMKSLAKTYGDGSIGFYGDLDKVEVSRISSGLLSLDWILGGGIPEGRILEIYGPESSGKTTLAIKFLAEVQKKYPKDKVAFIDVEHALDPEYAQNLGLNMNEIIFAQPNSAEEALNVIDALADCGEVRAIVLDSVAKLAPRKEVEGNVGDSEMAMRARLMSQALRKITPKAGKNNCTVFFINQVRSNLGMTYGCLHADCRVNFTDGRSIKIKEVVDKKIKGEVWSYDVKNKKIHKGKIVNWYNNGEADYKSEFISFKTLGGRKNGVLGFTVTNKHKILTDSGWKEAEDVLLSDRLVSRYNARFSTGTARDFLIGTLVGDSHISIRSKSSGSLRLQDNENKEYELWKVNKLKKVIDFKTQPHNHISRYSNELAEIKINHLGKRRDPFYFLDNFSWMGLAVWIMDDAHLDIKGGHIRYMLCIGRLKEQKQLMNMCREKFEQLGLACSISSDGKRLYFTADSSRTIANNIKEFIPECMQYKLPESCRGKYKEFELDFTEEVLDRYVSVIDIEKNISDRKFRKKGKYDIQVEGFSNYMIGGTENGIVVHNSPEVTPGGSALKFDASIRIRTSTKKIDEFTGETTMVVKKNKVGIPFRKTVINITFGEGFDYIQDIITVGLVNEVITRAGAMYYFGKESWRGEETFREAVKADPKLAGEIEKQVRAATGV